MTPVEYTKKCKIDLAHENNIICNIKGKKKNTISIEAENSLDKIQPMFK